MLLKRFRMGFVQLRELVQIRIANDRLTGANRKTKATVIGTIQQIIDVPGIVVAIARLLIPSGVNNTLSFVVAQSFAAKAEKFGNLADSITIHRIAPHLIIFLF